MGWAPLAPDAPLDGSQTATTAPPATPAPQDSQTPPATPVAAPTGFAPLPANAQLDAPTSAQPDSPELQGQSPITITAPKLQVGDGHVFDKNGNVILEDKGNGLIAGADTGLVGEDGGSHTENDPKLAGANDAVEAMLKSGASNGKIIDYLKARGASDQYLMGVMPQLMKIQQFKAQNPTYKGSYQVDLERKSVSNSIGQNVANSDVGALGAATGNAVSSFSLNPDEMAASAAAHPASNLAGTLIGGTTASLGAEAAAAKLGAGEIAAPIISDLYYGGTSGANTAQGENGAPPTIMDRVKGALKGSAVALAGRTTGDLAVAGARDIQNPTPSDTPDYAQLARDLNIKRTPATNSKTGVSTVLQYGLDALPGGTPIKAAAQQEAEGLATAARNVADSVGPVSNRQGAGAAIAQGAQDYKTQSGAEGKALYQQRDNLMGGSDAPVSLDNFSGKINQLAQQFPNSPALQQLREHPVIRQITDAINTAANSQDGQVTLGEATEALSHIRGVLRNLQANSNASPVVIGRVNGVEQALEDDVMNSASAADQAMGREAGAPGSAVKAQQDADAFWADRAQALNGSLKKPIQSATDDTKMSGEAVYNQVLGDMDQKSGNLARLRDTWFRLPQEAKDTFAATAIDDAGRSTPGQQNADGSAWSFQSFLTNLNKMSPQARNIVFGSQVDSQLQQIATYANRLRQLDRIRNFSNSAQKYFAGAFIATVGHALMNGDIGGAAEAVGGMAGAWSGAKLLLATPAMRDWTAKAMKAATTGNETAARVLTQNLSSIAQKHPAIADGVLALKRAVNDNAAKLTPAAASAAGVATVAKP